MASLEPVAAGFTIVPTKDRERSFVRDHADRDQFQLALDGAQFEIRLTREDHWVVLIPFRSYDAASRVLKAFETAAKAFAKK
jgi:hypothetical protein